MDAGPANSFPIGTSANGNIMQCETGTDANGSPIAYSLDTSELEIDAFGGFTQLNRGKNFARVRKIAPDIARISGTHQVYFLDRNYPNATSETRGPFTLTPTTQKISIGGVRGRSTRLRISANALGTDIRIGEWRIDVTKHGESP